MSTPSLSAAYDIDTILVDEETLSGTKGGVDDTRDPFRILQFSASNSNRAGHAIIKAPVNHVNSKPLDRNLLVQFVQTGKY
jgi:hypothetical protein